jgi:dTDP-4-amino-4,6-dideoxygalactose transaminase
MTVPFVDLKAQYQSIAADIDAALDRVISRADFILGEEVEAFEAEFARYCGVRFAVGLDNGTSALELALRAYGVGPGDEVITAANTYIATAFAITSAGALPVFVDMDPDTYTMDVALLEEAITDRTRAIIPVHLYGHPADMDAIMDIARRHDLVVVEDACQAHGAKYKGRRVGSLGHAAAFSFYPAKNLGAYGDAGMLVTNDERADAAVRMLRNHGQCTKYYHLLEGYNHRLDTIQAAVLRVKLRHLDAWNAARREHAQKYNQLLGHDWVLTPTEAEYAEPVYHLYVICAPHRDELQAYLHSQGIQTGIHYPIPIHKQPAYAHLAYDKQHYPIAEQRATQILSLPMYPELRVDAIGYVVEAIRDFVRTSRDSGWSAAAWPRPSDAGLQSHATVVRSFGTE